MYSNFDALFFQELRDYHLLPSDRAARLRQLDGADDG